MTTQEQPQPTGLVPPPAMQAAMVDWDDGKTQALMRVAIMNDKGGMEFSLDGASEAFHTLYPDIFYHIDKWWLRKDPGMWKELDEPFVIEKAVQMLLDSPLSKTRDDWQRHLINQLKIRNLLPNAVRFGKIKQTDWNRPFNLDSGTVLNGAAFSNGRVFEQGGSLHFSRHDMDDWYPYYRDWPMPTEWIDDIEGGSVEVPSLTYDPFQDYPNWLEWTSLLFPEQDLWLLFHELLGATIMGTLNQEQVMPVLQGESGAGKGTLLRVIGEIMAGEVAALGSIFNLGNRFATDQLLGKPFAVLSDLGSGKPGQREYDAGMEILKQITGGDPTRVEPKYQKAMTLNLDVQIWAASNFIPDFPYGEEDAAAWARRLKPLPVTKPEYARRDPDFISKFRGEYGNICIMAIQLHQERLERGGQWTQAVASETMNQQMTGVSGERSKIEEWMNEYITVEADMDIISLVPGNVYVTSEELIASLSEYLGYEFQIQSPTWRYAKERLTSPEIGGKSSRKKIGGKSRNCIMGVQLTPPGS